MVFVSLISENCKLKQPKKSKKNIFTFFLPKKETVEEADTVTFDTEISIKLPENANAFLATKFEEQEIIKIISLTNSKKRLWVSYNRAKRYKSTLCLQRENFEEGKTSR